MSEQRIEHGAAAAAGSDADPGEGQGLANDATQRSGEAAETDERREMERGDREDPTITGEGDTEGERTLRGAEGS
jgi:hypothetical protein